MALIDPTPFLEHVVRFSLARVRSPVGVDIGTHVGKQVSSIACLADRRCYAFQLTPVVLQDLAMPREVVLLQGGCCQGGFGVEEAG